MNIENVKMVMSVLSIKQNSKDYWTSKTLVDEITNGSNFTVKIVDDCDISKIKLEFYSAFDSNIRTYYLSVDKYKLELRKLKLERLCTT